MIFAAALVAAGAHAAEVLSGPYPAEVLRVIDGDTFVARVRIWLGQDVIATIRLRGIDAAELRGPCAAAAQAARDHLAHLLGGGPAVLTQVSHDKYGGRYDARAALPDGTDLAEAMHNAGHARRWSGRREGC